MIIKAYAKINWHLAVLCQREDGYHELDMVMQHIDLYDLLDIVPATDLNLSIYGDFAFQADDSNLVLRAARALQKASSKQYGAHIKLHKAVPLGAGLGGGSADAAAALCGLNDIWGLGYTRSELQSIGLSIGADVPYCLEPRPAHVYGIGEHIKPFIMDKQYYIVILKPQESLNTKAVFARYSSQGAAYRESTAKEVIAALRDFSLTTVSSKAYNDLQLSATVLLPDIGHAIDELHSLGAGFVQMSGSGSAVYGVFLSQDEAVSAYKKLKKSYTFCHECSTLSGQISSFNAVR